MGDARVARQSEDDECGLVVAQIFSSSALGGARTRTRSMTTSMARERIYCGILIEKC